ncbi:hypothetical protein, partial [Thalassospira xiamenensis]|uniref:hypothetical protein n=1 Tax=Thalassospira xiamenensis TaxID=220697 RepID=UPI003AA80344
VRSVKRDNAENQRARIAPGLDRHGIGWWGAGVAGRIGCQRADGAFAASTEGGGCLLGAWFVRSVKCENAEEQRARIAPELRPDWVGTGSAGRVAGSGWQDRLPAGRWCVRRCRKVGHRWRELCACHAATRLPLG